MPRDAVSWLCVVGDRGISWVYYPATSAPLVLDTRVITLGKTEPVEVDRVEWTNPRYGHQN
jgi:hypothetical protein